MIRKMFLSTLLLTVALSASLLLYAKNSTELPLIPRQLLFGNVEKASPFLSPDGSKLAYIAPDENNVLNVWVKDLNSGEDKKVTSEAKRGIRSYSWQYDSKHILYLQDKEGDENWHIYQSDIDTQEIKDLTPFEGVKSDLLDYNPKFPNEVLVQMNRRNPSLFDVYRLNLQTGHLEMDTENPGGVIHYAVDNQSHVRAVLSYSQGGSMLIRVRDSEDLPWREFLTFDADEIGGKIGGFSSDNQSIYLFTSLNGNTIRLLKVSLQTGETSLVAEDPQHDLSGMMMNPVTYELEAIGLEKERPDYIVLDASLKPDFQHLSETFQTPFSIISRDLANENLVVASLSDQRPTNYYLFHRNNKSLEFLFNSKSSLLDHQLSEMKPISFLARDGMKLYGYLTLPVGKDPQNLPTILFVHGGPAVRDSWGFSPNVQWLANRGYAVLQVNYRGSAGYGKQYLNAGNREWGRKMHHDLLDAKQWAIQEGFADPDKVAIYGGSYGGYATLVGLAFTPDEFCCGVDIVGPSNLITLLQTIPTYWSPLKAKMDRQIGSLDEVEFLKERSPYYKAHQIKKPLLIAQGANDPRVKQAESNQMVEIIRHNQLPVDYLLFKDEGHGFARPENRLKFSAAAEEFLARILGGRHELPSAEENYESLKK